MTKKHLLLAAVLVGVGTLGIAGLASAASSINKPGSLASELAQKFNLKQTDVQAVIDNHRTEMQSYREQTYEQRLAQAVTDGKLTAAQKDKIIAKHKELETFMASLKGKTRAEQKTAMYQKRTEIQDWETANNIPAGYLGGMGKGFGHRFGHGDGMDGMHDDAPATQ